MFASLSLALPLLLLSPLASAGHVKRPHHRRAPAPAPAVVEEQVTPNNATHALEKRQSFGGRGTFYYVNVGPGACGKCYFRLDVLTRVEWMWMRPAAVKRQKRRRIGFGMLVVRRMVE